jgi:hypothetical protein
MKVILSRFISQLAASTTFFRLIPPLCRGRKSPQLLMVHRRSRDIATVSHHAKESCIFWVEKMVKVVRELLDLLIVMFAKREFTYLAV